MQLYMRTSCDSVQDTHQSLKLSLLDSPEVSETTLISEYLKHLFVSGVPVESLRGILDSQSYLDPLYAEAMFTSGKMTANEW